MLRAAIRKITDKGFAIIRARFLLLQKLKASPDAVIQLAMQLAYFEMTGKKPLTYEAAITTLFDLGRTETIRSWKRGLTD